MSYAHLTSVSDPTLLQVPSPLLPPSLPWSRLPLTELLPPLAPVQSQILDVACCQLQQQHPRLQQLPVPG
jgi:hypothetical protein